MLARRKSTPIAQGEPRRLPHCRTCGIPMRGHSKALCQLGSPEPVNDASLPSTPPLTPSPTPTSRSTTNSQGSYPNKPISLDPSWEVPPQGTFFHRRNPYVNHPSTPSEIRELQRTLSWISTEKADSEFGDREIEYVDDEDDGGRFSATSTPTRSRVNITTAGRVVCSLPLTPPTSPANSQNANANTVTRNENAQTKPERGQVEVDVVDAAGNRVVGLDISTLNENIKSIIRQADSAGYYATIVRPRIGFNRGSVDIRTKEDADKHTTIFVSTAPDTMSINVMCSEAFRKAKLITTEGGVFVRSWVSVFLAMLLASLVSFWGSLFIMRIFS